MTRSSHLAIGQKQEQGTSNPCTAFIQCVNGALAREINVNAATDEIAWQYPARHTAAAGRKTGHVSTLAQNVEDWDV